MRRGLAIAAFLAIVLLVSSIMGVGCGGSKTIVTGGAPVSSGTGALQQTLFVSGNAATGGDGSQSKPFKTIQAAINAVPIPTTVAESDREFSILIAPGDYDEDLAVTGPVRISLIGLGPVRLGDYSASSLGTHGTPASTTTRNIVWTSDTETAVAGGSDPQLIFIDLNPYGIPAGPGCSTNRISGQLTIKGTSSQKVVYQLASLEIDSGGAGPTSTSIDVSTYAGQVNAFLRGIRCKGAVHGNKSTVGHIPGVVEFCKFEGVFQCGRYAQLSNCAFEGGMDVGVAPAIVGPTGGFPFNRPGGLTDCFISGTFTGPPGSLVLDDQTNAWFVRSGAVLAGGATKVLNGHAEQTVLTTTALTLTLFNIGSTVLADPTTGAFAVTLPTAVGFDDLRFPIKNISASVNTVIVTPVAGELIDNAPTRSLASNGAIDIVAHGGNWWIIAKN